MDQINKEDKIIEKELGCSVTLEELQKLKEKFPQATKIEIIPSGRNCYYASDDLELIAYIHIPKTQEEIAMETQLSNKFVGVPAPPRPTLKTIIRVFKIVEEYDVEILHTPDINERDLRMKAIQEVKAGRILPHCPQGEFVGIRLSEHQK